MTFNSIYSETTQSRFDIINKELYKLSLEQIIRIIDNHIIQSNDLHTNNLKADNDFDSLLIEFENSLEKITKESCDFFDNNLFISHKTLQS